MWLKSYAIEGFRAYSERVTLIDMKRVNVIVGPNNIGKTCLLLPLRRITRADPRCVPILGSPDGGARMASKSTIKLRPSDFPEGHERGAKIKIDLDVARFDAVQRTETVGRTALTATVERLTPTVIGSELSPLGRRISFIPASRSIAFELEPNNFRKHEERRFDGSGICFRLIDSFRYLLHLARSESWQRSS